ncbi:hypothetical protein AB0I81_09435 [Nonomuraea sp. NPDC050404]|uniref:HflX-like GTP-binding protein n=1 Tax=Nonomuraea sp. NPDC050404 TaxID=3155783 RepID=UPI003407FB5A
MSHQRRRFGVEPVPDAMKLVVDADVLIAGLFSAKRKDHADVLDDLAAEIAALGGRVVQRFVQRRGVSGGKKGRAPGGKANMDRPYSTRTLMSTGKVHEIANARTETRAAAVVFVNELTARQRTVLTGILGCPALSRSDLQRSLEDRPE